MKFKQLFFQMLLAWTVLGLGVNTSIAADDLVTFDYQGRVKVNGSPFNGTGQFKFSILNTSASATLWSNDGTGTGGTEPSSSIPLSVSDGIFDVMIGDPAAGMQSINSSIFNSPTPLKLRTWFNDGVNGFQKLNPDSNLANITLVTLRTGGQDFIIYVNGTTGNDSNNGLTTNTAKKTIQAAVNIVPPRLNSNVTIDIADGVYREEVNVNGISAIRGKALTFLGDETWSMATGSNPTVRITGTDSDVSPVKTRLFGIYADQCSGVTVRGIYFNYCATAGFWGQNGSYTVLNSKATNCGGTSFDGDGGFVCEHQSKAIFTNCDARQNQTRGFFVAVNSRADITSCSAISNTGDGFQFIGQASVRMWPPLVSTNNGGNGISGGSFTDFSFQPPFSGSTSNNASYGVSVSYNSFVHYYSLGGFTNTGNALGTLQLIYGSSSY
ncbi:MAG: right-handed parallel beta-helix repeat-containing protein [Candidatus Sumerlaeaceae bacterium]|nr:right-handed parallel beta-helix repeat-containing protein [Candidatus Sumerlaeaceae bacterium]